MSVENVPAVVNIYNLKGQFIAYKFSTGWAVGVVENVETKKSVAGQFALKYKSKTYCCNVYRLKRLKKEDTG
jgi:hypothetical protein